MTEYDGTTADEAQVARYVEAALAATGPIELTELCAERSDLVPAVREALAIARALDDVGRVAEDPFTGSMLAGRYDLGERIGAGAMGAVYRARDRELGRDVAVKLLQPGLFPSPPARARFLREAEALARIRHPSVVTVHDRGTSPHGVMYLVMDLLPGQSLARVAALAAAGEGGTPVPAAFASLAWLEPRSLHREGSYLRLLVRWAGEVAQALAAAHAVGVCHRDVKPSNILLDADGRAVLADFGIAAHADDGALTASHATLGTPWYLPPERARGHVAAAPQQDVYSLGATLYHLLTGRPPFVGDAAEVLAGLRFDVPDPAVRHHPGLPLDLQAILDVAMDPDPGRRYRDAGALAADLSAFLEHRPVAARRLSSLGRAWRRVRRRPAKAMAVVAVTAALGLALTAWSLAGARAEASARDRAQRQGELIASLPGLLAIEGDPERRLLEDLDSRTASIALLDAILGLGEDLPTRLLRAALRLDQGDHTGAAADLDVLEHAGQSAYLRAVAARYRGADSSRRGVEAVNLADLPPPETDVDHFVAAFHVLRTRDTARIAEVATDLAAVGKRYVPARDLRLLVLLTLADTTRDRTRRQELFQEAHDEALVLVGLHGKTARTQHVLGTACIGLGRYADAEVPLREALALRPGRHGPLNNLGIVLYQLGRFDEAEEFLAQAQRVQPWAANTRHTLARVLCARDRFEAAEACAAELPEGADGGWNWKKPHFLGHIAIQRALVALRHGDRDAARAAAEVAVGHYTRAVAVTGEPSSSALGRAYARALVASDWDAAVLHFLTPLSDQLDDAVHLVNLATLLDADRPLAPAVAGKLKEALLWQALRLNPGRTEFEDLLEEARRNNEKHHGR